jgi:putative transposase
LKTQVEADKNGGMETRQSYPSDLNDKAWTHVEPLLPTPTMGRPRKYSQREMLDAIWYVLVNGISWRALPHEFPPWQTVYAYFQMLQRKGVWQKLNDALREQVRVAEKREEEPSLLIADSQSVKTTQKGGRAATMAENG